MAISASVRRPVKAILRPAALPLLRRLWLPFEIMLPRLESLEQKVASIPAQVPQAPDLREAVENVRGTVNNLVRTWLRLQNEVSHLATSVPETTANAVQAQIAAFEERVQKATSQLLAGVPEIATGAVQGRLAKLEEQLQAAERQWQDDISGRGRRVDDTLRFLLDRVEFVRREMMFELRYGVSGGAAAAPRTRAVEPRILSPDKIDAARAMGALYLNLGCGHITHPDYVNIDMRDLPGIDVVAEVGSLPFEPSSVDEISSAHLVEHFPQEELTRRLLPHWHSLIKPGGKLRMITPDGEAMLSGVAQGSFTFEDFRQVLFGGQDYEGDFHYNLLTPDSLCRMVEQAGFIAVEVPVRARRNGQCFEFELTARRG